MAGYKEVLTWVLCSYEENFSMLNRKDDGKTSVIIENPRSSEFEVCLLFLFATYIDNIYLKLELHAYS